MTAFDSRGRGFDDSDRECSLQDFKNLREIVVDQNLFTAVSVPASTIVGYEYVDGVPEGLVTRPIVKVLPRSIEKVKFVGRMSIERALATICDLEELKEERLPNLREVMMNCPLVLDRGIVHALEQIGVALVESDTIRDDLEREKEAREDMEELDDSVDPRLLAWFDGKPKVKKVAPVGKEIPNDAIDPRSLSLG